MIFDLQKASIWKRISAYLFDIVLLAVCVVGFALLLSALTGYDNHLTHLNERYAVHEAEYGITFDITAEEYAAMSADEVKAYDAALAALSADDDAVYTYNMLVNLSLVITTLSILLGYLALEFAVPLLFGNGQTLGKKIFGVALMRTDGVKINAIMLFVRTILGKYTIETMIPVLILLMIFWGSIGLTGTVVLLLILVLQLVLLIVTRNNSLIHDLLANTVAVDFASQMIFASEEEMLAYKKKVHAERAARAEY